MKKILIALSASYFDETACQKLLLTCEKIYTTQVRHHKELQDMFGDRIHWLPDQSRDLIEFIKAREIASYPDAQVEFVTYGTLLDLSLEAMAPPHEVARQAKIESLQQQVQAHLTDTRRLNYLSKLGQYHPKTQENPAAYTEFVVMAHQGQSLRDALDRLMVGVVFDTENRPIPTPLATVSAQSLADGTITPGLTYGPEGFRVDPMEIRAPSS